MDARDESANDISPKRRRRSCVFNCTITDDDFSSPKDRYSWELLVRAAEIRGNDVILRMDRDISPTEVPEIYYHNSCRNSFTKKRNLDLIVQQNQNAENNDHSDAPRQDKRESHRGEDPVSSSSSALYARVCIFCADSDKWFYRSRNELRKCIEMRADETIRRAAHRKNDHRMMAIVVRDLVAAEAHYHKVCYRDYTRPSGSLNKVPGTGHDEDDIMYSLHERMSYDELFSHIRNDLFRSPRVVRLTDLTSKLLMNLTGYGVTIVKTSTKKHIQRKLVAEFGDSLKFTSDQNGRILVYPETLTRDSMARECMKLHEEVVMLHSRRDSDTDQVKRAATILRGEIKNMKTNAPWPPQPVHLTDPSDFIPDMLCVFLKTLMSKRTESVSNRVQRLVESLGQDIVYGVTNARIKTPKHILLPTAVKTLTGNVELIKILNRLGHGISYTQLEEIETALAIDKLEKSRDEVPLPQDIQSRIMVTVAWDNIDRLEETLSGGGTSHRVNGIVVQRKSFGPTHQPTSSAKNEKRKIRAIDAVPYQLPVYNAGRRVGPKLRTYVDVNDPSMKFEMFKKTLMWLLARVHNESVCNWTGFNVAVRNQAVTEDVVGYLPTINAPATNLSTVYEILVQTEQIRRTLELESIVVVFDQALYAKAVEIIWKRNQQFREVIPRMGVFHTLCNLMSIIGRRFEDAGLKDLCIESGIIAAGSVGGVLDGRKYKRAVRFHKLMYEALLRMAWDRFTNESPVDQEFTTHILNFSNGMCNETYTATLENPMFLSVATEFHTFLEKLRLESPIAGYWMSYMDLVDILLTLTRASREGDWKLHLQGIRQMIPWCFAYDKINYARYLSAYYAEMTSLETEHPAAHEFLIDGGFSVQIGSQNTFGRIPVDQTIEETVNKDTQTPGGTKGFSLKPGAVSRYYLTAEYRAKFLTILRESLETNQRKCNHPDQTHARIKRDDKDVRSLVDMMNSQWINPFSPSIAEITSISTGAVASETIVSDLTQAHSKGLKAYKDFSSDRLEMDTASENNPFHGKMSKLKLATFTNLVVSKKYQSTGKEVIIKSDRNLFAKMILIAETRQLSMKRVLAHKLGPIPVSLATAHGTARKTDKSSLQKKLLKDEKPVDLPMDTACIVDGMFVVQKLKADGMTFSEISDAVMQSILREGGAFQRIDVVFDVYRPDSIKNAERINRGSATGTSFNNISPGHRMKQWTKFLSTSENKNRLIHFFYEQWIQASYTKELGEKVLYVTTGDRCTKLTRNSVSEVHELRSSQEEADTRLLLHAAHCARSGILSVVVISSDTDVFVLCIAFAQKLACRIYIKKATSVRTQYFDLSSVAEKLGASNCDALLGMHAYTGCDTVSAFAGKGKLSSLRMILHDAAHRQTMTMIGSDFVLPNDLKKRLEEFTCRLYSSHAKTESVNELRFFLFCARRGRVESWELPPCHASLVNHMERANYQCAVWRRTMENFPEMVSPVGHGWTVSRGTIVVDWGSDPPAPDAVLELLSCSCKGQCYIETCSCMQNNMKCTYMCEAQDCSNQAPEEDPSESSTIDDDDDDDDESDDESENMETS